ncbi:MAG: PASTA domain-containing protein [Elusimicrobia bacterium]|nr:PASTA domain-containing protein [Elusimicrobiota bacterium]
MAGQDKRFKKFILNLFGIVMVVLILMFAEETGFIPLNRLMRRVPDLSGLDVKDARLVCRIKDMSLKVSEEVYSDKHPEGEIISQTPPGMAVSGAPAVNVVVSKGSPIMALPDLKGLSPEEAVDMLKSMSLSVSTRTYVYSDSEEGKVASTVPEAGSEVHYKTPITLNISRGSALVTVPNLAGKSLAAVQKILSERELRMGTVKKEVDIDKRFGIILRQWPLAGKEVEKNTPVTIVINEEE